MIQKIRFLLDKRRPKYNTITEGIKEFLYRFCFIPILITGIGMFFMIAFRIHDILLIPMIFLGSFFGFQLFMYFIWGFDTSKELHDGDD